jgi:hypothetical protein
MRQSPSANNFVEGVCEIPTIDNKYDATANDSDKSWTVPNNEMWKINFAHVILVSTATVGNRQMTLQIVDENSNMIIDMTAGTVQAASLTRHYLFIQGIYRETAFVNGELQIPIALDLYLKPGWSIRFLDEAAVAAAADDMTVSFQMQKYVV